jgi:hypothetical protein
MDLDLDCLVGCINSFKCGDGQVVKGPDAQDFSSMSPFVKATFGPIDGEYITVGNKSYPQRNHEAVIEKFEYGSSNGLEVTMDIIDEQGGAFHKFFEEIKRYENKEDAKENYSLNLKVKFGWLGTDCNIEKPMQESPEIFAQLITCDASFVDGKIKCHIVGTDIAKAMSLTRGKDSKGGDKTQKLSLKEALIELFKEFEVVPKFLIQDKDGGKNHGTWGFEQDYPDGPKNVWQQINQDPIATAWEWITPYRVRGGKGIVMTGSIAAKEIIFWEDPNDGCSPATQACWANHTGLTVIVNAGKCSPVLEFSPKINWALNFNAIPGVGGAYGSASQKPAVADKKLPGGCELKNSKKTGVTVVPILTSQAIDAFGCDPALIETQKGTSAHLVANAAFGYSAITTDLKIMGNPDPRFVDIISGKAISVVVINPFHLVRNGNDECPDWLAQPGCNEYLTNKNWLILKRNHNISSDGNYVTTLNITLPGHIDGHLGGDANSPKLPEQK